MIEKRNEYSEHEIYRDGELMSREFRSLGCDVKKIGKTLQVSRNGRTCYLQYTSTSFTSLLAARILKDKELARNILQEMGLNIPKGRAFKKNEKDLAYKKLRG